MNREGYESYLEKLKGFISNRLVFGRDTISEIKMTRFAVQFKYKDYIDVDILVSPVWWEGHPKNPNMLFAFLRDRVRNDAEARHRYTFRLAGIQTYSTSFMCTKLLASEHFADVKMSVCLIDAGSV